MGYEIKLSSKAAQDLKTIGNQGAALILSWLYKKLQGTFNPRLIGGPIEKYHLEKWKYSLGIYDIYAYITQSEIIILCICEKENRSIANTVEIL